MSRTSTVPERIAWAVELLDVQPDDRILEIGCGSGVAASLVCDRLDGGYLTAIDRSATAVSRAAVRNEQHVAGGTVSFRETNLASLEALPSSFDKAFAVNVNVFWTTDAGRELVVLRDLLVSGGRLLLVYDGPGESARDISGAIAAALERHGFGPDILRHPDGGLLAVAGRRAVR